MSLSYCQVYMFEKGCYSGWGIQKYQHRLKIKRFPPVHLTTDVASGWLLMQRRPVSILIIKTGSQVTTWTKVLKAGFLIIQTIETVHNKQLITRVVLNSAFLFSVQIVANTIRPNANRIQIVATTPAKHAARLWTRFISVWFLGIKQGFHHVHPLQIQACSAAEP